SADDSRGIRYDDPHSQPVDESVRFPCAVYSQEAIAVRYLELLDLSGFIFKIELLVDEFELPCFISLPIADAPRVVGIFFERFRFIPCSDIDVRISILADPEGSRKTVR